MAIVEKYVTADAEGGGDGSSESPWTLAEAIAAVTNNTRVNIKSGAYEVGATTWGLASPATITIFRGYKTTPGDLDNQRRKSDGTLDFTDMPVITQSGKIELGAGVYLQNLMFVAAINALMIGGTANDHIGLINCKVINTASNAAVRCVQGDDGLLLLNCDISCTGTNHADGVVDADIFCTLIGCRLSSAGTNKALLTTDIAPVLIDTLFTHSGTGGIGLKLGASSNTDRGIIQNCTFFGLAEGLRLPDADLAQGWILLDNHVTDCTLWINGLRSAPNPLWIMPEFNTRSRDITILHSNVETAFYLNGITTSTGGAETDFVAAASGNFNLKAGAPAIGAGFSYNNDCGAYQSATGGQGSSGNRFLD